MKMLNPAIAIRPANILLEGNWTRYEDRHPIKKHDCTAGKTVLPAFKVKESAQAVLIPICASERVENASGECPRLKTDLSWSVLCKPVFGWLRRFDGSEISISLSATFSKELVGAPRT